MKKLTESQLKFLYDFRDAVGKKCLYPIDNIQIGTAIELEKEGLLHCYIDYYSKPCVAVYYEALPYIKKVYYKNRKKLGKWKKTIFSVKELTESHLDEINSFYDGDYEYYPNGNLEEISDSEEFIIRDLKALGLMDLWKIGLKRYARLSEKGYNLCKEIKL